MNDALVPRDHMKPCDTCARQISVRKCRETADGSFTEACAVFFLDLSALVNDAYFSPETSTYILVNYKRVNSHGNLHVLRKRLKGR